MKKRILVYLGILSFFVGGGISYVQFFREADTNDPTSADSEKPNIPETRSPTLSKLPPNRSFEFLTDYGNPEKTTGDNLESIAMLIESIRPMMGDAEFPAESNHVFLEFLQGKNPMGISVDFPLGMVQGNEIVDRSGNPIFFHFISQKEIELRSAGQDKILWTEDDILRWTRKLGH